LVTVLVAVLVAVLVTVFTEFTVAVDVTVSAGALEVTVVAGRVTVEVTVEAVFASAIAVVPVDVSPPEDPITIPMNRAARPTPPVSHLLLMRRSLAP
jgi:hypothetical protein